MSREVSVLEGLYPGGSIQGVSVQGIAVQWTGLCLGSLYPLGHCPGESLFRGLCPEERSVSRGFSVQRCLRETRCNKEQAVRILLECILVIDI